MLHWPKPASTTVVTRGRTLAGTDTEIYGIDLREVKGRGIIFLVTIDPRRPSAENYREQLKARRSLALMHLHRGLAKGAETNPSPSLRAEFAARYRELIGVAPSMREEFRAALGRIEAGGGMPVQDVIDVLHMRHSNGSTSSDGGTGASGN